MSSRKGSKDIMVGLMSDDESSDEESEGCHAAILPYKDPAVGDKIMVRLKFAGDGKKDGRRGKKAEEENSAGSGWFPAIIMNVNGDKGDVEVYPTRLHKQRMSKICVFKDMSLKEKKYGSKGDHRWYHVKPTYFEKKKMDVEGDGDDPEVPEEKKTVARPKKQQKVVAEVATKAAVAPEEEDGKKKDEEMALYRQMEEMRREIARLKEHSEYREVDDIESPLPEYPGVRQPYHKQNFLALDKSVRAKFVKGKDDGVSGIGDPNSNNRQMCSRYTDVLMPCASRELEKVSLKSGEVVDKFISKPATFIHMGLLGEAKIRNMAASTLNTYLRQHALCNACKPQGNACPMLDIVRKGQCCSICKIGYKMNGAGLKDGQSAFEYCKPCYTAMGNSGNAMSDELIKFALAAIGKVFGRKLKNFSVVSNKPVTDVGGVTRTPDVYMEFECYGLSCIVIVENDPNSHAKYKEADENEKMVEQVAPVLRKFLDMGAGAQQLDAKRFRVLLVRLNSKGAYEKEAGGEYDSIERVVIMRRWIIWWITHIREVRNMIMMYMFYKKDLNRRLLWENSEYFASVYEAPKPAKESHLQDWAYALDYREIATTASRSTASPYAKMNEGSRDPVTQMPFYKPLKEQVEVLPRDLMAKVVAPILGGGGARRKKKTSSAKMASDSEEEDENPGDYVVRCGSKNKKALVEEKKDE